MRKIQAGMLAAVLVLSLTACSARNEWTSDDTYSGKQHREQQEKEQRERDAKK